MAEATPMGRWCVAFIVAITFVCGPTGRSWQPIAAQERADANVTAARRADMERASAEAARLRQEGTAESLRASVAAYAEAIAGWRSLGDRHQTAVALRSLGQVQRLLGQSQDAIASFTEAASLLRDEPGPHAATVGELAGAYYVAGDSHRALELYDEALAGIRAVHDQIAEAKTLNNVGTVLLNPGRLHDALATYEESLAKGDPTDRAWTAITLSNIGATYSSLGEIAKAKEYLNRALDIRRAIGDKRGLASTEYLLGDLEQSNGDPQKGFDAADRFGGAAARDLRRRRRPSSGSTRCRSQTSRRFWTSSDPCRSEFLPDR